MTRMIVDCQSAAGAPKPRPTRVATEHSYPVKGLPMISLHTGPGAAHYPTEWIHG